MLIKILAILSGNLYLKCFSQNLSWLSGIFWLLCFGAFYSEAATRTEKKTSVTKRFLTSVSFPYHKSRRPARVVYGNDNYGYFSTNSFTFKHKRITLKLIPPGYKYKINFFAKRRRARKSKYQIIGTKKFISPVPEIYKGQRGYLRHGRFSSNFLIVSGALPRGKFWNHHFRSNNPDIYKKSKYRFSFAMILNRIGEIVWLHIPVDGDELFQTYVSTKPIQKGFYGVLLGKKAGLFQVVKYDGTIVRSLRSRDSKRPFTMHHDFLYASKNTIYAISSRSAKTKTLAAKKLGKHFLSDIIIKVDLKKGRHKKIFDLLKYYQPKNEKFWTGDDKGDHKFVLWNQDKVDFDFLHLNTIQENEEGFLIGVRNLNKIIMMDKNFGRMKWSLGWNDNSTFKIEKEEDRFHHIHTPMRMKSGNIIVFDNGYMHERSRIIEYQLNFNSKTAKKAWSFEPKPKLYSKDRGSIALLKKGNVLAYFVNPARGRQLEGPTPPRDVIIEIDRRNGFEKARMTRAFEVMTPGYRAIPINIIGEETFIGSSL
jgi:hypothetical protein